MGSCNFGCLWKNLLVLIYFKLHSKSCDYLYEFHVLELQIEMIVYYILYQWPETVMLVQSALASQRSG